jgi:cell wall-associated NlpC family hydrolase
VSVSGADIARQARSYLGVPYVHLGRSRHGVDCAGLVLCVAHELGLTDWDDTHYSRQPDEAHLRACLEQFCRPVCCGDCVQAGDVLLMEIRGRTQHLAIVTEVPVGQKPGRLLHAYQTPGRVVEHSLDARWRRRIRGVYRWRGLGGAS